MRPYLTYLFLAMPLFLTGQAVYAQKTVKGRVTGASGADVLIGVNVMVKGTQAGTTTDVAGNYVIQVPTEPAVLVFSYIGYVTREIAVQGDQSTLDVTMETDLKSLEEVVVVGYGTQRKSDLTGSVTQIKMKDVGLVATGNIANALQGRAPGVAVFTNSVPGASPTLRIRGSGSISAGKDPLYVVDGFPLMNSNLNDINPSDILSMEILKDASGTAIYGSRGANGVVLITTRSGSKGRRNMSVSLRTGLQNAARLIDKLETPEFVSYINDSYAFRGGQQPFQGEAPVTNTDWQREVIQKNALMHDYTIGFDGGSETTNYMLSVGYFSQDGLIKNVGFDKVTLRNNLQHKFNNWLTVGSHFQAAFSRKNGYPDAMTLVHQRGWPTMPVRNPDGSWFVSSLDPLYRTYIEGSFNAVLDLQAMTNKTTGIRGLGDVYAEFQITRKLKFRTNFGADITDERNYAYTTSQTATALASNGKGSGGNTYSRQITKLTENILSYADEWDDHRFTATGVYSWQDFTSENLSTSISGFQNDATGAWDLGLGDRGTLKYSSGKLGNRLISYTTRLTYSFKDRYLLTATGRYDGSSRFGANNKFGFFPSVGLGWNLDRESFFKNFKAVSELKLRGSYGVTGNQEIGNYRSLAQLTNFNYIYNNTPIMGYSEGIGNPDLRWERTRQLDLGVDLSLWNRLNFTFDYYTRLTSDLLYNVPIPSTSGFSSLLNNVGEVKNQGFEITLGGTVVDKEFKLDVSVNASRNVNKVTKLYGNVDRIETLNGTAGIGNFLVVGAPVNAVWARKSLGIIRTQEQLDEYTSRIKTENSHLGAEMYADLDGNGSINSKDYVNLGATEPAVLYGFNINAGFKGFRLDIQGQGASKFASAVGGDQTQWSEANGAYGYSSTSGYQLWADNNAVNRYMVPSKDAYSRMWSESNPKGDLPRAGARNVYLSDRTNGNWSYFLIRNIQLAYQFSAPKIKGLEVFVNAQNYVSFAKHTGYNPENGDESYPWAKALILGINKKF